MAILIPSKNIYSIENKKIRENIVNRVEFETFNVVPDNGNGENVFSGKSQSFRHDQTGRTDQYAEGVAWTLGTTTPLEYYEALAGVLTKTYYSTIKFSFPKVKDNKRILRLVSDESKALSAMELSYVKEVSIDKSTGVIECDTDGINPDGLSDSPIDDGFPIVQSATYGGKFSPSTAGSTTLPNAQSGDLKVENTLVVGGREIGKATAEASYDNEPSVSFQDAGSQFSVSFTILSRLEIYRLKGNFTDKYSNGKPHTLGTTRRVEGDCIRYTANSLNVAIDGDFIGIELKEIEEFFGSGNKPFSISAGEYMQNTTRVNTEKSTPVTEFLAEKIFNQYENGKETATVLCSISDYYDESNAIVVTPTEHDKALFRNEQEVIPYVFGSDGKDRPMSKYKDGSPKKFAVVGVKTIYDGAVWQELTLQELPQELPQKNN